ncbi:MAG: hypothetical protein AB7D01_05120 [Methanoculleus sp.]
MTETEIYVAPVRDGAMLSAPVYEGHKRGKNWMATIAPDPAAPGGVARTFVPRGRGEYYYIVSTDLVGQPVEFGADYYSSRGKRDPKRWYGVVRALTGEEIRIEHYETAAQAIAASRNGPDRQALEEERAALLARLAEINALLGEAQD